MGLSQAFLPEFDQEMANTRKTLERVPDDKLGWKPHEKSGTMGWLANHVATLPRLAVFAIEQASVDVATAPRPSPANSRQELLDTFDKQVAAARAAIAGASDERLLKPWSLLLSGRTIFTLPRNAVLRSFFMNHSIHHRAQLGVYLRLNNIPVPAIYGPSADEGAL
ncbi:MAG TPA: DinB family protein [Candidatus Methylomirabilis sp.]|nr:DinB family protein [Candidatus Methylomirabilis sp.]